MYTTLKETKGESKQDNVSSVLRSSKCILSRLLPDAVILERLRAFEEFRLDMMLRSLKHAPFNAKMNALNEMNRLLNNINYFPCTFTALSNSGVGFDSPRPLRFSGTYYTTKPMSTMSILLRTD